MLSAINATLIIYVIDRFLPVSNSCCAQRLVDIVYKSLACLKGLVAMVKCLAWCVEEHWSD